MVAQGSANRSAQSGPFSRKSKVISVDPPNILANTAVDVAITFAGVLPGDRCSVVPAALLEAGIVTGEALCVVAGIIQWRLANVTVAAINPAAVSCTVLVSTAH